MFVDSHCHLDRLDLTPYDGQLNAAIDAARARDVSMMLCVCIGRDNRQAVLDIAKAHADVYASVGIHPCEVNADVVDVETLKAWASAEKVVALGESGLDYFHDSTYKSQQIKSFSHHLQAGAMMGLPVIVHTRSAQEDTLHCMREHASLDSGGVMHCFTESWEMAKAALDMNFYISLSGIVTFKNAADLRDVAKKVPLDRLLIETDAPYLAPVPYRGKPNEPKYVREVGEFIADLRGMVVEDLAQATRDNFLRLFRLN